MAQDEQRPEDDTASLWEKLWGPGRETPADDIAHPDNVGWGSRRIRSAEPASPTAVPAEPSATESTVPGADVEDLREYLEVVLSEQIASASSALASDVAALRSELEGSVARQIEQLRTELLAELEARFGDTESKLAVVRTQLGAELDDQLAGARDAAVVAVDARMAGSEASLLARLGRIPRVLAEAAEGASALGGVLARLDALEQRVALQLQDLAHAVEASRAESVTSAQADGTEADLPERPSVH